MKMNAFGPIWGFALALGIGGGAFAQVQPAPPAAKPVQVQPTVAGGLVDIIRARGNVRCGVQGPSNPGFGAIDSKGIWRGFNIDLCRGIASMVLGDSDKIAVVALTTETRFPALQSGEIDVMTNNTTWTMQRDTQLGFAFPAITFYDGQGIMVRASSGIDSATKLDGATICVPPGTTTEIQLSDWFRARKMRFTPVIIEGRSELTQAYATGRCDAITYDSTTLYSQRTTLPDPQNHVILPEKISKEPLTVTVRQGDDRFRNIVAWMVFTLINAEELGVKQSNVREMLGNPDPRIRRLLGVEGDLGRGLGISNDFAITMISAIGNYGESFERNLGTGSALHIDRGLNKLYTDGGILYAPPNR